MESYCSGPALFLTETYQVSACSYVQMLSMRKMTVMLQIYKKPHKLGLQYKHNTRLVCTCAVERLVFPHLNPRSFTCCTMAPTELPQAQKNPTLSPLLFCLFKASDSNLARKGEKKICPGKSRSSSTLALYKEDKKQARPAVPLWSLAPGRTGLGQDHGHPWTHPDYSITKKTSFALPGQLFPFSIISKLLLSHVYLSHIRLGRALGKVSHHSVEQVSAVCQTTTPSFTARISWTPPLQLHSNFIETLSSMHRIIS